MAVNAYLVIDGRPGPSTSKQDAIDILSFSFGATQTSVIGAGSSGGRGPVGPGQRAGCHHHESGGQGFSLLFDDCVTGNYLKKVDIIYDKPMGDDQEDYYKIHMEDALITSIQHSGSNENPMESISFAFSKVKVSYNPEEDGNLKGFIDKGFDVLKLKPW
jgi:type VI secretion system secreted protein Hcp